MKMVIKNKKFIVFLSTLILSSFQVVALNHAPTPSGVFGNIYNFFKGIVTGSAGAGDTYFISFILYFVIFMAIYSEGLRYLKFFGDKGTLNKPGKAFAVAASLLSCIALFLTNKENVFVSLIAPFGVWGGVVLAAIIGYITYKFIKDAELFKDDVMIMVAGSTAVGVTFAGFLLSSNSLMGWGFLIMLIAFGVGAWKHVSLKSEAEAPERERKAEERKKKYEAEETAKKTKKKKKEKRDLVSPIKKNIIDAIEACEEAVTHLDMKQRANAKTSANKVERDLKGAWRNLRLLMGKQEGKDRSDIEDIMVDVQVQKRKIRGEVIDKIPRRVTATWKNDVSALKDEITNDIMAGWGHILIKLDKFHS